MVVSLIITITGIKNAIIIYSHSRDYIIVDVTYECSESSAFLFSNDELKCSSNQ